jgi:hypothetical protein
MAKCHTDHGSSTVTVTLNNLLPTAFPARQSFEEVVRSALEGLPGGPWMVKLGLSSFDASRISVEVRGPARALLTSFATDATRHEIRSRLMMFSVSEPSS